MRIPGTRVASRFVVAVVLLGAGLALSSVASATPPPTSPGGIGVRLLPDASSSLTEPLALSYVVERIPPGSHVVRRIEISNTTDAPANISVYPAAARYVENHFTFAPGRTEDALARWTTVSRSVVRLASGATSVDTVTITVPKRESAGERYAVVWAQVSAPSPTQKGIQLVNRVGIRMYVSVGKGGLPAAKFTIGLLSAGRSASGVPLVAAMVRNVGQRAIDIVGALTLSQGPGGLSAGPFPVTVESLLAPRHSTVERVQLNGQIPRGPWTADLTLTSGGTQRKSVALITFPIGSVTNQHRSLDVPLLLSALIALAFLVAGSSVVFTRRHRLGH